MNNQQTRHVLSTDGNKYKLLLDTDKNTISALKYGTTEQELLTTKTNYDEAYSEMNRLFGIMVSGYKLSDLKGEHNNVREQDNTSEKKPRTRRKRNIDRDSVGQQPAEHPSVDEPSSTQS